jgi:hypothetical protein
MRQHHHHKRKIKPLQVIALLGGIVLLVAIIRISNRWDDKQYYHAPSWNTDLTDAEAARTVFICDNKESRLYHRYTNCEELEKCTAAVKDITVSDAETMGRTECGKCRE